MRERRNLKKLGISYSNEYLRWNLGSSQFDHPTKPVRAKLAVEMLQNELDESVYNIIRPEFRIRDRKELAKVHTEEHISNVLDKGLSYEWDGTNFENGKTAGLMFAGTARLVEGMLAGDIQIGFNPQGAKHHAQEGWSEGFCVFNDFAWAAKKFKEAGWNPVYVDWDVNAGDGVQNLLEDTDIPTFSIHGHGIYPTHSNTWANSNLIDFNYIYENEEKHWYNYCLQRNEGDEAFNWAIDEIAEKIANYKPDVILLATGADGHEGESWGLKYTYEGYDYASKRISELANEFCEGKVLIGGAGGYQPYTHTPRIWANVVKTIVSETK